MLTALAACSTGQAERPAGVPQSQTEGSGMCLRAFHAAHAAKAAARWRG